MKTSELTSAMIPLESISEAIPNLDTLDSSDLARFAQEALEVARNFQLLASYARLRANAIHLRELGSISEALTQERLADIVYRDLQPWASW